MCTNKSIHTESTAEGGWPAGAEDQERFVASLEDRNPGPTRWRLGAPVLLVVSILVVFMPALDAGLVRWDDDALLVYITRYRTLDASSLRWMFTTSFAGHFQPLTWLSYTLDWALWKRQYFGYHLTSVALHALTAVVFYFLVRTLLSLASSRAGDTRSAPMVLAALFAAGLFALHPLRAETVAWLAGRSGLLAGFFYVLCVTLYVHYGRGMSVGCGPKINRFRWWAYGGAVVACLLSLLAKASAVTLPIVLLILDRYPLRRVGKSNVGLPVSMTEGSGPVDVPAPRTPTGEREALVASRWTWVWLDKIPFLVLAVAAGVRAYNARREGGALYTLTEHDIWARVAQAFYGLTFYVWKTVWPTNLGPLYEVPPREVLLGSMLWGSVVFIVVAALLAFALRRRWPFLLAAFAVYGVVLLPVAGFIQSGPQLVADRYSYLSCLVLAALGGGALYWLLRRPGWCGRPNGRAILILTCTVLLAVLARETFAQANIWLSGRTLWLRGVKVSPASAIAHTNYADALIRAQMLQEAAEHYQKALELKPYDAVALHHFADLQRMSGHTDAAIRLYLRALVVDPHRDRACLLLAQGLVRTGHVADAVKVLRQGVRDNPGALELSAFLADLLASYPDDEIRDGQEAVRWALYVNRRRGGKHLPSMMTLATAYAEAGQFADAIETADRALALAEARGDYIMTSELNRRLNLFRQHQPYRSKN